MLDRTFYCTTDVQGEQRGTEKFRGLKGLSKLVLPDMRWKRAVVSPGRADV